MFGKIKDKLKSVFLKSEEVIEDSDDTVEEIVEEPVKKIPKPEKKKDKSKKESKPKEEKKKSDSSKEKKKEEEPKEKKEKKKEEEPPVPEKPVEEEPEEKDEGPTAEELVEEVSKEQKKESKPKKEKKVEKPIEEPEKEEEPEDIPDEKELEETLTKEESSEDSEEDSEEEKPKKKGFLSRMFGKKDEEESDNESEESVKEEAPTAEELVDEVSELKEEKESKSLDEEKEGIVGKAFTKLKAKKITEEDFEKIWVELQIFLLEINIAFEIVTKIEEKLKEELVGNSFNRFKLSDKIRQVLENEVEEVLKDREANFLKELNEIKKNDGLVKILVLGVNGTGKTTTIAKIVHYLNKNNLSCVVAAADTFRAAAIEQLEEHSQKLGFKLIVHKDGSDPAAVAYDSIEHAKAKKLDVVLIDTAGRMPNNSNLMLELQKIKRVSEAQMAVFVGDSISGNDLIDQIQLFNEGVNIDGCILTKVDTDERPGSIVTTAYSVEKPIYFVGMGQTYDDLAEFDAKHIAKKLFEIEEDE